MPKPRPLSEDGIERSIAVRLGRTVDRIRQIATRFGIRPYRVFLVHTKSDADERGEGRTVEIGKVEILPTPLVASLDSVAINPMTAGMLQMGMVRVSEVSVHRFTRDALLGLDVPGLGHVDHIPQPYDFFYEIQEDGRGDRPAWRQKYRLATEPWRKADDVQWVFTLERASEDRGRKGEDLLTTGTRG